MVLETIRQNEKIICYLRWVIIASSIGCALIVKKPIPLEFWFIIFLIAFCNIFLFCYLNSYYVPRVHSHIIFFLFDLILTTTIVVVLMPIVWEIYQLFIFGATSTASRFYLLHRKKITLIVTSFMYLMSILISNWVYNVQTNEKQVLTGLIFVLGYSILVLVIMETKHVQYKTKDFMLRDLWQNYEKLQDYSLRLHDMAIRDSLTKLYNYRYFEQRLPQEIENAKRLNIPFSLILIDIDFFKEINDKYGHPKANEILKKVADVFRTTVRSIDIVGRFGGEEFYILLPGTDIDNAVNCAERLRLEVEKNLALTASP